MYVEIEHLTAEEFNKLNELLPGRVRAINSIYTEVCRIEADCSLDRVVDELELELTEEEYQGLIENIAQDLAGECEDTAFQEMCERADEITRRYLS